MTDKHPLAEALRAEILKLASEGDSKSDGALTAEVLLRITRVAKTGRDLLVTLSASPPNLAQMIRPKFGGILGSPYADELLDEGVQGQQYQPLALSSPAENFGMTAIREIIAAVNSKKDSPKQLVEALAAARSHGLTDVARELEAKLGIVKPVAVLPASVQPLTAVEDVPF